MLPKSVNPGVPGVVAREAEDSDALGAAGQPGHEEVGRRLVHVVHGQGDHAQAVRRSLWRVGVSVGR